MSRPIKGCQVQTLKFCSLIISKLTRKPKNLKINCAALNFYTFSVNVFGNSTKKKRNQFVGKQVLGCPKMMFSRYTNVDNLRVANIRDLIENQCLDNDSGILLLSRLFMCSIYFLEKKITRVIIIVFFNSYA